MESQSSHPSFQTRRISVTEFARGMGRTGDLGRRHFSLLRGVEGIEVHQRMQKNRGEAYQAEVSIQGVWERNGESVEIFGRIDGIETTSDAVVIEEFKTSRDFEDRLPLDHMVHVLQAECYAWLWARREGGTPGIRLEYVHPDPQVSTRRIEWQPKVDELNDKIETLLSIWLERKLEHEAWIRERNERLRNLSFPFSEMRPGQQELMNMVDQSLLEGRRLTVQAPTGIGKTIGVFLPALRALGEGRFQQLMIATCRNTGKRIFEEAAGHLFPEAPGLRMLTLLAKDRVCKQTGSPCDCESCPLALGFYDRLPAAMSVLRKEPLWDAETWQRVASEHQLCPFALMMNAAREADVILGDLNYALDPSSRLEFLFGAQPASVCLLIDEAHHLPDRSRSMLSASLHPPALQKYLKSIPQECKGLLMPAVRRVIGEIRAYATGQLDAEGWPKECAEGPDDLYRACGWAIEKLEASFADTPGVPGDSRLELYRSFANFRQSMDHRQSSHVCTMDEGSFHHLCLDTSAWLKERLGELAGSVVFSGTLHPLDVFMRLTGVDENAPKLVLSSPYEASRFRVDVEDGIPLVWKARGPELYERLTRRIVSELTTRSVKTLVFFPSYSLMEEVAGRMPANDLWMGPVKMQPRGLQEEGAEEFLRPFRESEGPVCGLAVLGGALNEGIDLPGTALEAVIIVSIGLPGLCRERELMRRWYESHGGDGFLMAYTTPGLTRVLQAMGRVIRGPEDRGTALLIDPRYRHPLYEEYLS